MKRKYLSNTYLREALKYQIKLMLDDESYYISVKKLIKLSEKFIINNNIIAMDDGYYILEIVPKKDNYAMRVFLNDKKEVIEYYFDVIKDSGIDEKTKIPYFDDLYVDVTLNFTGTINVLDEEELENAYKNNEICKEDYELANKTKDRIIMEIKNNTNKLMNIDIKKYLGDM